MKFIKTFFKVNKFPFESFKRYYKYSSRYEIVADILIPFLISAILAWLFSYVHAGTKGIFEDIDKINNPVLAAISILAGFNVASITVLATSQSKVLDYLRSTESKKYPNVTLFEMLMGYFSWAIAIQLIVILLGILMLIITTFLNGVTSWSTIFFKLFWFGFIIWVTIILHSIFVSIRNLKYLYIYLTSNEKK